MAYKLLLTDAHSPLGMALSHVLEQETFTLVQPQPGDLVWNDAKAVDAYLREQQPDIVINSLAWSPAPARQRQTLTVSAAKSLAQACAALEVCAIHLSSHQVFGGENKTAYDESDQPAPVDVGGRALWRAEKAVAQFLPRHIILRLSWLIGARGDNLLTALVGQLSGGQRVSVAPNKRGAPTFMTDVGRVLVAMVKQILCGADNWGVMHYTSGDPCSEADFARHLAKLLEQRGQLYGDIEEVDAVEPVTSAVLSGRRCLENFGIQSRTWRQGLASAVGAYLAERETLSSNG
ncbi:sugar nucleotide-binding protein [Exilibacterium tricleocarpae]|uniref:dTDP-4-dehydrorhamnose reductase n=1 Tax=Exilibacterium tricleocarpae TaxID=2591008 RepID=A0A545T2B0_9GAMM|nr:sugar nucleotide-binding protein [Exilibacterium tricleocarpae]TQV71342.1 sugar nucleotide-binding protein [Exilibacterium tricleocarpae]